jgi:glutamate-1-semialdehyde 2,1-aminomutase
MNPKENSKSLFERAKKFIPGGVNSPVRAFKAVGGDPVFIRSAKGSYLFDEDGNKYVELINSWGPMILGHAHEVIEEAVSKAIKDGFSFGTPTRREVEIAELITAMMPNIQKVRMVNSGTEAAMSAIRLARGFTGRNKVIKFEGCYHGHADSFLISAGSGAVTMGHPDSPGVTQGVANDTLTAPFNDLGKVKELLANNKNQVAGIILEPVVGNMGCVLPAHRFLEGLRKLCDENGTLLIFDEVMTGFRLDSGGAQKVFNINPDITVLGKIIGGGMPVGAFGARSEIMDHISPLGPVYQAGTLSGNPIAMAAGKAMLQYLYENPSVYSLINNSADQIVNGFKNNLKELKLDYTINQFGSMFSLFFTSQKVSDFTGAKTSDTMLFARYFRAMLNRGIYLAPSQYETLFISAAIDQENITQIIQANKESLVEALSMK